MFCVQKLKFLPLLVTSQATSKSSSSSTGSWSSSQAGSSPLRDVMDRERDSGIFSRRDVRHKGREEQTRSPCSRWRSAVSTQGRDLSGVQPAYPGRTLFTKPPCRPEGQRSCLFNEQIRKGSFWYLWHQELVNEPGTIKQNYLSSLNFKIIQTLCLCNLVCEGFITKDVINI